MRFILALLAVLALSGPAHAANSVTQLRNKHATTNITTSAWVSIGTLSQAAKQVYVYNSSTSGTLYLGVGATSSETQVLIIPPGMSTMLPLAVGVGQVNLKAVDATVSLGDTVLDFFLAY